MKYIAVDNLPQTEMILVVIKICIRVLKIVKNIAKNIAKYVDSWFFLFNIGNDKTITSSFGRIQLTKLLCYRYLTKRFKICLVNFSKLVAF